MARPIFSEMLLNRRRQLGLSIKQASNVLRLKEEVLVAFEEGNFESIPKSGYAQGMLSSYARYLGLNAKTVVNQFSQDLFDHERGTPARETRRKSRQARAADDASLYSVPEAAAPRSQRAYVDSHGFLPTSGGFAGDLGDFATTSAAHPRFGNAGGGSDDSMGEQYPQGRPYTARIPSSSSPALGHTQRQRPASRRTASSIPGVYETTPSRVAGTYGSYDARGDVTTRRVMPTQYRDDMRLDNDGRSYEAASSAAGRRSSRNIASTARPNVRRRDARRSREQLRNRDMRPMSAGGLAGAVSSFLQDRTRVMVLLIVLLCVVLTGTIVFSVSSCMRGQGTGGKSVTVTETDNADSKQSDSQNMTSDEEEKARADAAAAKAAENESDETERTIEVTVADGEVTWIEIEYDGSSDIAETVTGPWNRTYTVRQSISINVSDTSAVTVTEDGKKLEFDSKASGIGTITIQVSSKAGGEGADGDAEAQPEGQDDGGAATPDQSGVPSGQGEPQQVDTSASDGGYATGGTGTSGTGSQFEGYTLDTDGYYYGADGYYDANGVFYPYS